MELRPVRTASCRNPVGVGIDFAPISQSISFLATLGFVAESRWDSSRVKQSLPAVKSRLKRLKTSTHEVSFETVNFRCPQQRAKEKMQTKQSRIHPEAVGSGCRAATNPARVQRAEIDRRFQSVIAPQRDKFQFGMRSNTLQRRDGMTELEFPRQTVLSP
jgi:hypothetical protein